MSYPNRDRNRSNFHRSEMFDAVCAKCGAACQVPFRPNGKKDVLCSNCFKSSQNSSADGHQHQNFHSRQSDNINLETLNSKLDKILSLLSQ